MNDPEYASPTIELIRSADGITNDWLTSVLRAAAIDQAQSVTSHVAESLGDAAGLLGMIYRVHLNYSDENQSPSSIIVKLPVLDPGQRGVADTLGFYRREVTFYQQLADKVPLAVPRLYGAVQDVDTTDFVIAMEDLGHLEQLDQLTGASLTQAATVVEQIARFHATWHDHPTLDRLSEVFVPLAAPAQRAVLPTVFKGAWSACKRFAGDVLTPEIETFGDRWGHFAPHMLHELATHPTLVHGDFRADNMMFDADGQLVLIDFQIIGIANGLYDIAYFMCQSIEPDVRRGHEHDLLSLYVDTLASGGVNIELADAWRVYRAGVAFCLIKAVTVFRGWESFDGRQRELMTTMLSRTISAIEDADALAHLP